MTKLFTYPILQLAKNELIKTSHKWPEKFSQIEVSAGILPPNERNESQRATASRPPEMYIEVRHIKCHP